MRVSGWRVEATDVGYTVSVGRMDLAQFGGMEWIILLIILAILFLYGPKKIPELMRGLGRGLGEFQRGKQEIEREIKRETAEASTEDERRDFERKVVKVAKGLGIAVDGRAQKEIKLDIAKGIDKASREHVVSIGKELDVPTEGLEVQRVKEQVIRKLGV